MSREYATFHERLGGFETHDAVLPWIAPDTRVLDVGCSTGYFARRLVDEKGCQVIGLEADSEAAEEARSICERVYVGDLNDSDFLGKIEERADVIFCGDVIEHLSQPSILLERAHGWLEPEGVLICSVPNIAYWKIRYELLRGRFDYRDIGILDRTHLRFYTRKSFEHLLAENAYQLLAVKPVCADTSPLSFRASAPERRSRNSTLTSFLLRTLPSLMATQFLYRARSKT